MSLITSNAGTPFDSSRYRFNIGIPPSRLGQKRRPAASKASNAARVSLPLTISTAKPGIAQCLPLAVGLIPLQVAPDEPARTPAAVKSALLNLLSVPGSILLYHWSIVS